LGSRAGAWALTAVDINAPRADANNMRSKMDRRGEMKFMLE
jgi:hypothetical protein